MIEDFDFLVVVSIVLLILLIGVVIGQRIPSEDVHYKFEDYCNSLGYEKAYTETFLHKQDVVRAYCYNEYFDRTTGSTSRERYYLNKQEIAMILEEQKE